MIQPIAMNSDRRLILLRLHSSHVERASGTLTPQNGLNAPSAGISIEFNVSSDAG